MYHDRKGMDKISNIQNDDNISPYSGNPVWFNLGSAPAFTTATTFQLFIKAKFGAP